MQKAEGCWPIRKAIMYFFYHVYLETEKEITDKEVNFFFLILFINNNNIKLYLN